MPVFLKGLSGYRSIVHLNKVVASSNAAPTQPKQTEQGSAPPRLLPSSRTGRAAAWGCRRPRGLLTLTSVKAGSGLPALQVTSGLESARTRTPIPPPSPSPAVQRGRSGCDRAHASSPCSAALLSEEHRVVVVFFFWRVIPTRPSHNPVSATREDGLKQRKAAAARGCELRGSAQSGRPPSRAALGRAGSAGAERESSRRRERSCGAAPAAPVGRRSKTNGAWQNATGGVSSIRKRPRAWQISAIPVDKRKRLTRTLLGFIV